MTTMITDTIAIGAAEDARQLPAAVDATLNVAIDFDIPLMGGNAHRHKVGLFDGPGNDEYLLMSAVLMLHSLNRKYRRILVHCPEGSSRSVMVVAVYVSIIKGMDFDKTLREIMNVRGVTDYRPVLYQQYTQLIPKLSTLIFPK
jgi:protein-tyrosine phosphatase